MFTIEFYDGDYYNPHAGISKYLFRTEREAQWYLLKMGFNYYYDVFTKDIEWTSRNDEYTVVIRQYDLYQEGMEVEDTWKDED